MGICWKLTAVTFEGGHDSWLFDGLVMQDKVVDYKPENV